jgi:hypothetical protein
MSPEAFEEVWGKQGRVFYKTVGGPIVALGVNKIGDD